MTNKIKIRADQLEDALDKTLNMTVDEALSIALAKAENKTLDSNIYDELANKLGETESTAFTMGLASEGIEVTSMRANTTFNALKKHFTNLANKQGCIYEDDFHDVCYGLTNSRLVSDITDWIFAAGIPMKKNPSKGDNKYEEKIKNRVQYPDIRKDKKGLHKKQASKKAQVSRLMIPFTAEININVRNPVGFKDDFSGSYGGDRGDFVYMVVDQIDIETFEFDGSFRTLLSYEDLEEMADEGETVKDVGIDLIYEGLVKAIEGVGYPHPGIENIEIEAIRRASIQYNKIINDNKDKEFKGEFFPPWEKFDKEKKAQKHPMDDLDGKHPEKYIRECECFDCGHNWDKPVVFSDTTPNISGEPTAWCPNCGSRRVHCSPWKEKNAQALDFAMEQEELERAVRSWQPPLTNLQEWIDAIKNAQVWADLKALWDSLWSSKGEGEGTQEYVENVELEEGGEDIELARKGQYKYDLERVLGGTVVLAGEGYIDLNDMDDVYIGMVWDDSGFTPGSAIYVQQGYGGEDSALQEAFEILETHEREANPEYLEELFEEWGERADEIFTEGWDGATWTMKPKRAAQIIKKDKYASKYIDIYEFDPSQSEAEGDFGELISSALHDMKHGKEQVVEFENGASFTVALAETPAQKSAGLEVFEELHPEEGMLFPFEERSHVTFHMGKVKFPIDILFLMDNPYGLKVAKIIHNAQPGVQDIWSCPDVTHVLEISGGACKKNKIKVGTKCTISGGLDEN